MFTVNFIFCPSKTNSWRLKSISCNRNEPKQCINTWQITEVSNSTSRHAGNYGVPSPPKIKVDHNIQLDSLTINLANINIIISHFNFVLCITIIETLDINFQSDSSTFNFILTCQQWSWHMGCQRKMKFESPSRMLSHQRRTNPAKIQLENSTFKLIVQHEMLRVNIRV